MKRIDTLTVMAAAALVNVAATAVHEALGHGLAAAILGAHIVHVSSVDLSYDERSVGDVQNRIIAAAGPLANLIVGWLVVRSADRIPRESPVTRYTAWLFGTVNLFAAGGYLMVLSFANFGDMHAIVRGLGAPLVWQVALTLAGVAVSIFALIHGARSLVPYLGEEPDRTRRSVHLTLVPYLTMGVVAMSAGALNPDDPLLIVISACFSSFGGNAWLAWMPAWTLHVHGPDEEPLGIPRSGLVIGVGIAALLFDYLALAPGLPR